MWGHQLNYGARSWKLNVTSDRHDKNRRVLPVKSGIFAAFAIKQQRFRKMTVCEGGELR